MQALLNVLFAILISICCVATALICMLIPPLYPLLLCWPIPYLLLWSRRGWPPLILSLAFTIAMLAFFSPWLVGIWAAAILPPLFGLQWMISRVSPSRLKDPESWYGSMLLSFVGLLATIGVCTLMASGDPIAWLIDQMRIGFLQNPELLELLITYFTNTGVIANSTQAISPEALLMLIESTLRSTLPAILLIAAATAGYINLWISCSYLRRKGRDLPAFPPLSRFQLPKNMGFWLAGMMILSWFLSQSPDLTRLANFEVVTSTVSSFAFALFAYQGMALLEYMMAVKARVPVLMRVLTLFMAFVMFSPILTMVGMLDHFMKLRVIMDRLASK